MTGKGKNSRHDCHKKKYDNHDDEISDPLSQKVAEYEQVDISLTSMTTEFKLISSINGIDLDPFEENYSFMIKKYADKK